MTRGTRPFRERLGPPTRVMPNGLKFAEEWALNLWMDVVQETGSGTFRGGFLQLFGEDVRRFDALLPDWSFLFGGEKTRWVIGKNAHGALLLLESPDEYGTMGRVGLVDPLHVNYFTDENLDLLGLVGDWVPRDKLPSFLDETVYRACDTTLGDDEILAIKRPLSLGGEMEAANFQVEDIFEYYRTTGRIHRRYRELGSGEERAVE